MVLWWAFQSLSRRCSFVPFGLGHFALASLGCILALLCGCLNVCVGADESA